MSAVEEVRELLFITVPPPRSGHVVELLQKFPHVASAAAVYSGVDVVAEVIGTRRQIEKTVQRLGASGAPIENIERFKVDTVLPGARAGSTAGLLRGSCRGYVRCSTILDGQTIDYAASILAGLKDVARLYLNVESTEILLEVLASDKTAFDDAVMSSIQSQWSVVRSTRSLMVINDMSWSRVPSGQDVQPPTIFISLSSQDHAFGAALVQRLRADTGLSCWTYSDIPLAIENWPKTTYEAIDESLLHLYLISPASLASAECQREFGRSCAIRQAEDICCILLPECEVTQLPVRYQEKQLLSTNDFFAYARLLEWLERRLG